MLPLIAMLVTSAPRRYDHPEDWLTCRMSATSGPLAAAGAAVAGCMCVGAAAGLRALAAATAAKSGLRMTPSLTPSTTDWRASSGGAGTSQPDTRTCWKLCAASSACQLVRLMSGEPARPDIKGASIATPDSLLLNEQEHDTVRTLQYPLHMLALAPSNQNIHHYLLVSR